MRHEIRTCPKCKKKCFIDGERSIQCWWYCPNPFCREPLRGYDGQPHVTHKDYPYSKQWWKNWD